MAWRNSSRRFGSSSGNPKTQPSATRWAVLASITRTFGFAIKLTASRAASSGRHRITISASFSASRRAEASLRRAPSSTASSISPRPCSRSRISSPVVPAAPSMKIWPFSFLGPFLIFYLFTDSTLTLPVPAGLFVGGEGGGGAGGAPAPSPQTNRPDPLGRQPNPRFIRGQWEGRFRWTMSTSTEPFNCSRRW